MKIIGYQVIIQKDNDDYNEWHRIRTVKSPIYTTKEDAVKALSLIKQRMLKEKKEETLSYIKSQLEYEYKHQRSINDFLGKCQRGLMCEYKEVLDFIRGAEILEVYAFDVPTASYEEYNLD